MLVPRKYQREAVDSIPAYFLSMEKPGNPLVVLPTASGKSLVMAIFCKEVLEEWPDTRILILAHVKELLDQNEKELLNLWPEAPVGVYSAGLGRREINPLFQKITIAGIQSVFKKTNELGAFDLILVDEAHLIPTKGEGMYRSFLEAQKVENPFVKVVGLTATPYRLGTGLLTEGKNSIFDDICFEKNVGELVRENYLAPLVSKGGVAKADLSTVKVRGGEYVPDQMAAAYDQEELVKGAVDEILWYGEDRKSCLLFCSSIDHATHCRDEIRSRGITAEIVTGDTPADERDRILAGFKQGDPWALANVGVLTTGFNYKGLDLIALLRSTKSVSLYVQILGRGMRTEKGKENCLVLDFGGNILEHGPIDSICITKGSDGKLAEPGKAPAKECPECMSIIHAALLACPDCGYEWPKRELKHETHATDMNVMGTTTKYLTVSQVEYRIHRKEGSPDSIKVTYVCGLAVFSEWVCIEHRGYAQEKAWHWWTERVDNFMPTTTAEAVKILKERPPAVPTRLKVKLGSKFPEIVKCFFDEVKNDNV